MENADEKVMNLHRDGAQRVQGFSALPSFGLYVLVFVSPARVCLPVGKEKKVRTHTRKRYPEKFTASKLGALKYLSSLS